MVKIGCVTLVQVDERYPRKYYGIKCNKNRGIILPGGKWEVGETFIECARRELLEETGIFASDYKLVFGGVSEEGYYTYAFAANFKRQEAFDDKEGQIVHATWADLLQSAFKGYYELMHQTIFKY